MSMNLSDEHPNVINRDWRLQAITSFVDDWHSPTGTIHKAGTPVQAVGFVRYPDKKSLLTMPVPSPAALYISFSLHAKQQAEVKLSDLNKNILEDEFLVVSSEYENRFFDALQLLISVVIFSYTAIEVFANESIPDEYVLKRERQENKFTEIYSKDQVE